MEASTTVAYDLEGSLLEACDCGTLCPCWIGEDPDGGTCQAVVAYHFDRGEISGVDVGGLSFVGVAYIPGNILEGNFTQVVSSTTTRVRSRNKRCWTRSRASWGARWRTWPSW